MRGSWGGVEMEEGSGSGIRALQPITTSVHVMMSAKAGLIGL
jgi:hypothetical protein